MANPRPEPEEDEHYVVVPHRDQVIIRKERGHSVLVHVTTKEKYILDDDQWQLVFDDEGYGVLIHSETFERRFIEDVLNILLCEDDAGNMFTINVDGERESVAGHCRWYRAGMVSWSNELHGTFDLAACLLAVPKQGYRFYWRIGDMYHLLELTSFCKCCTKWLYAGWKRWQVECRSLFIREGQIVANHPNV